jgi:hypothetical protein
VEVGVGVESDLEDRITERRNAVHVQLLLLLSTYRVGERGDCPRDREREREPAGCRRNGRE